MKHIIQSIKKSNLNNKKHQTAILKWFDQHGRKDLPWQKNKTPYRVWVSEIMLQQTQVSTVINYFLRFMERFPTVYLLSKATEDEVLHLWTGLGYYSRARNLLRTAKIIVNDFQGEFPPKLSELEKLPGIGPSTAGAILAIAFGQKATILDGNVKRVLTRLHCIKEWPGDKKILTKLWDIAKQLTPTDRIEDYTQAMMDLGATVCTRGKPNCNLCPLINSCLARKEGIEHKLPKSKPRKALPVRQAAFLLLKKDNSVLLEKRPPMGIWGGLWCLPEISDYPDDSEVKKFITKKFQFEIKDIKFLNIFRHTFSHFHLDILPIVGNVAKTKSKIMEDGQQIWYNPQEPATIGLPAPVKLLVENAL